jgi:type 1 glutamine amidotransferase
VCFDADPVWRELCGAAWDWAASSHPPLGPVTVAVTAEGRGHPITAGVEGFEVVDEVYAFLDQVEGIVPLLTASQGDGDHPVLWARTVGLGRVVTDLLGHGPTSIGHPAHRAMLGRAAAWTLGGAGPEIGSAS